MIPNDNFCPDCLLPMNECDCLCPDCGNRQEDCECDYEEDEEYKDWDDLWKM